MIIVVIACLALYNFSNAINTYKTEIKNLEARTEGLLKIAGAASVEPLWQFNYYGIESVRNALLGSNEVVAIEIFDYNNKSLFKKEKSGNQYDKKNLLSTLECEVFKDDANLG